MAHVVKKMTPAQLNQLKGHYHHALIDTPPPGSLFSAKSPHYTITAYKSGKVLFQGKQAAEEASLWDGEASASKKQKPVKTASKTLPLAELAKEMAAERIIGSDEVGTGDYFGPITVCSVYCGPGDLPKLQALGVKDSKLMTDQKMIVIAEQLKTELTHSLLVLPNDKYNELQRKGYSQGKMKAMLHNQAIRHVIRKLKEQHLEYDRIVIDQFAEPAVYYRHLKTSGEVIKDKVAFHTKAEGLHLSVAAASILARAAFLKEMDALSEYAGYTLPKGAGAKVDQTAALILKSKGEAYLNDIAKTHFANTNKAKAIAIKE